LLLGGPEQDSKGNIQCGFSHMKCCTKHHAYDVSDVAQSKVSLEVVNASRRGELTSRRGFPPAALPFDHEVLRPHLHENQPKSHCEKL
jgi:hypothetical protein